MNLSPVARICGELIGDGHIQLQNWRNLISFYSKNLETIEDFNARFGLLFNVSGKIYQDTRMGWTRYKLFFSSKSVAHKLVDLGVPFGNKTNTLFGVPSWILTGRADVQRAFLRGLFDAEGSVSCNKSPVRWRIEIEMYKSLALRESGAKFMEEVASLLTLQGINCSRVRFGRKNGRKDGSVSVGIKLEIKPSSFDAFKNQVGFTAKRKAERLELACQSRKNR